MNQRRIQVLPQDVIDCIAAGEVVQRPASVVKELVENSLDAGATHVTVAIDSSSNKIVIQDNGHGIALEDLPLAVVRHATSKLTSTEDFGTLASFGFRGEALASVSLVSRLSILSRTKEQKVGYLQYYQGTSTLNQARPQARQIGTTVTIQDLFYNLPQRQNQRPSEEYHRILTTLQHYAMLYAASGVSFVCERKTNKSSSVDLNTTSMVVPLQQLQKDAPSDQEDLPLHVTKQVMGQIFGSNLVLSLQKFNSQLKHDPDKQTIYEARCLFSLPSYAQNKRIQFILFINHRRVECPPLQRACEDVYGEFTKHKTPVILLDLTVPPSSVDVNVHPTKQQVTLLHLEEIRNHLAQSLREQLSKVGQTFTTGQLSVDKRPRETSTVTKSSTTDLPPSQKVRTSRLSQAGALEPYLVSSQETSSSTQVDMAQPGAFAQALRQQKQLQQQQQQQQQQPEVRLLRQPVLRPRKVIPSSCEYDSILSLRRRIDKSAAMTMQPLLRSSVFVGVVSHQRSLLQCGQDLVMINHLEFAAELFYQLTMLRFGELPAADLGKGVDVGTLIEQHLEMSSIFEDDPGILETSETLVASETHVSMAQQAVELLWQKSEMLQEYYSISFECTSDKRLLLTTLPDVMDGYIPQPHGLPSFLFRLATEVSWQDEKSCFYGISHEIGLFYAQMPTKEDEWLRHVRHVLFPSLSTLLIPPQRLQEEGHWEIMTQLSRLYRVFERC